MKKLIAAFVIDDSIYFGKAALLKVKELQRLDKVITIEELRLIATFDLGRHWNELSEPPVIMVMDDGKPRWPTIEDLIDCHEILKPHEDSDDDLPVIMD